MKTEEQSAQKYTKTRYICNRNTLEKNRCCQRLQAAFDSRQHEIKIYAVSYTYTHIYAYLETCIHVHTYTITANPLGLLNTVVDKQLILSTNGITPWGFMNSKVAISPCNGMKLMTIIVVYQIHKPVCRLPRIRRQLSVRASGATTLTCIGW